jgi:hypothetical protein
MSEKCSGEVDIHKPHLLLSFDVLRSALQSTVKFSQPMGVVL